MRLLLLEAHALARLRPHPLSRGRQGAVRGRLPSHAVAGDWAAMRVVAEVSKSSNRDEPRAKLERHLLVADDRLPPSR